MGRRLGEEKKPAAAGRNFVGQIEERADPVFVHGKTSRQGSDARHDKFEKELFQANQTDSIHDKPPRFKDARVNSERGGNQQLRSADQGNRKNRDNRGNGEPRISEENGAKHENSRKPDTRNQEPQSYRNNEEPNRSETSANRRDKRSDYNSSYSDNRPDYSSNYSSRGGGGARAGSDLTARFQEMNLHSTQPNGATGHNGTNGLNHHQPGFGPTQPNFSRPPPNFNPQGGGGHYPLPGHQEKGFGGAAPPGKPSWKKGDQALAKYWEDGVFYPVLVTALGPGTAVVLFYEYGNHEEVLVADLRPVKGARQGRDIPPTPGLPPAFRQ